MFYKDNVAGELVPFLNLHVCTWSAPFLIYVSFVFASFRGSVLYQTSGIFASLNISAFIGIFGLAPFCVLLTVLFTKAANFLRIFPKMTVLLLELVLCFFMVISNSHFPKLRIEQRK